LALFAARIEQYKLVVFDGVKITRKVGNCDASQLDAARCRASGSGL